MYLMHVGFRLLRELPNFHAFTRRAFLMSHRILKDGTKAETHATSSISTGSIVLIVFLVLVVLVVIFLFLFKFWQKKKREEQYARLLKLFEEDDELELELGLRD
ncbi:hypothetical protein I3843_05G003500 [Carya illinoinensis]|uniref:Uncharacterized protein n=2 Tax=Carya illinoinensis TaxID=32201 RepID=A0A8T1QDD0_CARIL|nr:uncharacterized protein LOC122310701 [Carya illinoinensis]KAG2704417.1 hypothetical protein I3760_05G003500 [Carya illinoinensis]KAG6652389.1 hypothetical protein CIPAW_05G003600 [Carya illinoinensis]KAG6710442.1 hypothetical protein I3842_05G003700 [Carya illinoinensis]KAG7976896.1 hypothetical protein I3843_05G003500 [Carya illinoinensis]